MAFEATILFTVAAPSPGTTSVWNVIQSPAK